MKAAADSSWNRSLPMDSMTYLIVVQSRIEAAWRLGKPDPMKSLTAVFRIQENGQVTTPSIRVSSGSVRQDKLAIACITNLSPFPAVPPPRHYSCIDVVCKFNGTTVRCLQRPITTKLLVPTMPARYGRDLERYYQALSKALNKSLPSENIPDAKITTIQFQIDRSGKIVNIVQLTSSGYPAFDNSAVKKVQSSLTPGPTPSCAPPLLTIHFTVARFGAKPVGNIQTTGMLESLEKDGVPP